MKTRTRLGKGIAAAVGLLLATGTVQAVERQWVGGLSGNWKVAENWDPSGLPVASDTVVINGAAGTSVVADQGNISGITLITIYAGNTLGNQGTSRIGWSGGVINYGTLENCLIYTNPDPLVNEGVIQARAGTMELGMTSKSLTNTSGEIRAIDGGMLKFSGTTLGGQISIESGATMIREATGYEATLEDIVVANDGTTSVRMSAWASGNRTVGWNLTGSTEFTNDGIFNITQDLDTDPGSNGTGTKGVRLTVADTAILFNTSKGSINIQQHKTLYPQSATYPVYLTMNAAGFINEGTITVSSLADSVATGSAQFQAPLVGFTNAGTLTVVGPQSSIQMAGQTLTQTAGTLDVKDGGSVVAATVAIDGGTLAGNGSIILPPISQLPGKAVLLNTGKELRCSNEILPMYWKNADRFLHIKGLPRDRFGSPETLVVRLDFDEPLSVSNREIAEFKGDKKMIPRGKT